MSTEYSGISTPPSVKTKKKKRVQKKIQKGSFGKILFLNQP
jgi:hypothetical protein